MAETRQQPGNGTRQLPGPYRKKEEEEEEKNNNKNPASRERGVVVSKPRLPEPRDLPSDLDFDEDATWPIDDGTRATMQVDPGDILYLDELVRRADARWEEIFLAEEADPDFDAPLDLT